MTKTVDELIISERTAELAGRGVVLLARDKEEALEILDALGLTERLRRSRASR